MARMSNRDRIARAAEEARLAEEEKLAKKAEKQAARKSAKRPSKASAKASAKDVRMKVIWVVVNPQGKPVKTFAYPDKDAATSEVQRLTASTGSSHALRSAKVPMD